GVFVYLLVAVHTHVGRRYHGVLALLGTRVAVQAVDLVDACVYFVRVEYRLLRNVVLLAAHLYRAIHHPVARTYKYKDSSYGNEYFVAVYGNVFLIGNAFFLVGYPAQRVVNTPKDDG